MPCCGNKRRTFLQPVKQPTSAKAPIAPKSATPSPQAQRPPQAATPPVAVRYMGAAKAVIFGPVTNRRYAFAGGGAALGVDSRDAIVLLRNKVFKRV